MKTENVKDLAELLLDIKENIGEVRNEQKNMKADIKMLAQIMHKQIKTEEQVFSLQKEISEIKKMQNVAIDNKLAVVLKEIEYVKKDSTVCPNDHAVQNLENEVSNIKGILVKVAFALIPTLLAIFGFLYKISGK